MRSIRRDLTAVLVVTITAAMLTGGLAIYHAARKEVDGLLDYQLRQLALSARDHVFRNPLVPPLDNDDADSDFVIQVWGPDGIRLYSSRPHQALPAMRGSGYADLDTREGTWRVFVTRTRMQVIQVAQPMRVRNEMALAVVSRVLFPLLILLPGLSLLIWIFVGRGLAPLKRLAQAVATRTPTVLDPLPEQKAPEEVLPLVGSLNDLLGRLAEAIAAQKAFIADAAHELRTPIAALQLQAQLVERARTDAERSASLQDLKAGVRRSGHAVQQLLTLARQDPDLAVRPFTVVALAELARSVVAEHIVLAEVKRIDLGLHYADEYATVRGDPDALRVLLGNLLDNALRYTPVGGRVDVSATMRDGSPYLEVSDSGPGILEADRTRVFDRFYRGEATRESGTGLGLAIVKTIADRHGAQVQLDNSDSGGLRIRVVFPSSAEKPRAHAEFEKSLAVEKRLNLVAASRSPSD